VMEATATLYLNADASITEEDDIMESASSLMAGETFAFRAAVRSVTSPPFRALVGA
jgi:hypothetical protein